MLGFSDFRGEKQLALLLSKPDNGAPNPDPPAVRVACLNLEFPYNKLSLQKPDRTRRKVPVPPKHGNVIKRPYTAKEFKLNYHNGYMYIYIYST